MTIGNQPPEAEQSAESRPAEPRPAEPTPDQQAAVDNLAESEAQISTADMAAAGPASEGAAPQADENAGTVAEVAADERTPLMPADAAEQFQARWQETQADFVDDPRSAVTRADALVAEVMKRVAEEFARERDGLEKQWNEGTEASTEDLRLAFQRYRSFFGRLLSL
jgi:hypothetical protein